MGYAPGIPSRCILVVIGALAGLIVLGIVAIVIYAAYTLP